MLDAGACAVATRMWLVVGVDDLLLAAEHLHLLSWTTTGLLHRVSASVNRDVATIGSEMRRAADDGG